MKNKLNIDDTGREIMKLKALGYRQESIAKIFHMSQSSVSQRMDGIRKLTKGVKDTDKLFWRLILGDNAISLLKVILGKDLK